MKTILIFVLTMFSGSIVAQTRNDLRVYVIQSKDTLNIQEGLKNYHPIRFSWIKDPTQKVNAVEVTFGNGAFAYLTKTYKIAKDQSWINIDLENFRALEAADSLRKNKDRYSRIVIVPLIGPNARASKVWTVPFKIRSSK